MNHFRRIMCSLGGPPQSTPKNEWTLGDTTKAHVFTRWWTTTTAHAKEQMDPKGTQECEALLDHQASTGKLLNLNTFMHTSGCTTTHSFFIYTCDIVQSAIPQICISDYPVSHLNSPTNNIKAHHVFTWWTITAHSEE